MNVQYIACAQSSALDSATNRLSLFHLLDEITGVFPLLLPTLCVVALFEREAGEPDQRSTVLAVHLDGALVASFTLTVDFGRSRRVRAVNTINGLLLPGPGTVTLTLSQTTRVLAVWRAQAIGPERPDTARNEGSGTVSAAAASPTPRGGPSLN